MSLGQDARLAQGPFQPLKVGILKDGYADNAHKINSYRTSRASVADTVTFIDE